VNNSLEINGVVALTNPSPRGAINKNKNAEQEQHQPSHNSWWFLEKKVME
jgi:hypothetical protein